MIEVLPTTSGQAQTLNGGVAIVFHVLRGLGEIETIALDVDGYAEALARDILTAIVERNAQRSEGE